MPTVILLDVSLSMARPITAPDVPNNSQRRHLAAHGINTLLDYCTTHSRLEFVALLTFSSQWEQQVGFTREYDTIRSQLAKLVDHDKTCLEQALHAVNSTVVAEWGNSTLTQVIVITDGNSGIGIGSLRTSLASHSERPPEDKFPLPFPFPAELHIVCIAPSDDKDLLTSFPLYEKLVELSGSRGDLHTVPGTLTLSSTHTMFQDLAERALKPREARLVCGNLSSHVLIHPAPAVYDALHDWARVRVSVREKLEVVGFLDIGDVASPPVLSRHLMLPVPSAQEKKELLAKEAQVKEERADGESEDDVTGESKLAAFTVLLHGSLKVESMVAMVQVAEHWYGMAYSWADSKKKSNLMLALFTPGEDSVSWLGDLDQLGPLADCAQSPYDGAKSPFPVRPAERRSYAQNLVVWIKASGIQADVQKILRHARKLPDKQAQFYKELNRVRRAALSFGFVQLLERVAAMLERECSLLPGAAHPDAALQLSHAAKTLRSKNALDIAQQIMPLQTKFAS